MVRQEILTQQCMKVFDYVWSHGDHTKQKVQQQENNCIVCHSPMLTWNHFSFLIDKHVFNADDLSFYVFAFMLRCDIHYPYCIPKSNFVLTLYELAKRYNVNEFGTNYNKAFELLKWGVSEQNKLIRGNSGDENNNLRDFYQFLYEWCLRYNKTSDRVTVALELWSMFFCTTLPTNVPRKEETFLGYVVFPRLSSWLEYIKELASEQVRSDNNNDDDDDNWEAKECFTLLPSRDLWYQLLKFSNVTELDSYNPNDAWPLLIDNYVDWLKRSSSTEYILR